MNTLQLTVIEDPEFTPDYYRVNISIDGKDLIDLLRDIETSQLGEDESLDVLDFHSSLSTNLTLLPSRHFLGEPRPILSHEDKAAILICVCGCEGCWDFVCRMTFTDDTVIWSDFAHVHRSWSYAALGQFVFDRKQYESQFSNPIIQPWKRSENGVS